MNRNHCSNRGVCMQIHRDRCNFRDLPIYCVSLYMTKTYEYTWTVPLTCYSSVSIWTKWIVELANWVTRIGPNLARFIGKFRCEIAFLWFDFCIFFFTIGECLSIVRLRYVAIICNVILIYTFTRSWSWLVHDPKRPLPHHSISIWIHLK